MLVFWLAITGAITVALLWFLASVAPWINRRILFIRAARKLPCKQRHWFWGNAHQFQDEAGLHAMSAELTKEGHKAFTLWLSSFVPAVCLCHPDTIKLILRTAEPKPVGVGAGYGLLKRWIGGGILLSSGPKWERNRKLLTPAFHFDILKPYVAVYNKSVQAFMNKIDQCGGELEIYGNISLMTLDIVLRCALTYDNDIQEHGDEHPYVAAISKMGELIFQRAVRPWLYPECSFHCTAMGREWKRLCDYVHGMSEEVIQKRKQALQTDPDALKKRHLDFLDILLTARDEDGFGMPDSDIRAEVDTFMFAGHDTTASAISWSLYALAKFPEEQERVHQEVTGIMCDKPVVEWEDIGKLKYTSLFIKEVLRYFSVVYVICRETTEPLTVEGVTLPPGAVIHIHIKDLNHNAEVWPDHQQFLPERFATDSFSERDPYNYVPFSAGPRNCIGQNFALNEIKVALCRIVQRYYLTLDPKFPEVESVPVIVMRPKNGIHLIFTQRS